MSAFINRGNNYTCDVNAFTYKNVFFSSRIVRKSLRKMQKLLLVTTNSSLEWAFYPIHTPSQSCDLIRQKDKGQLVMKIMASENHPRKMKQNWTFETFWLWLRWIWGDAVCANDDRWEIRTNKKCTKPIWIYINCLQHYQTTYAIQQN